MIPSLEGWMLIAMLVACAGGESDAGDTEAATGLPVMNETIVYCPPEGRRGDGRQREAGDLAGGRGVRCRGQGGGMGMRRTIGVMVLVGLLALACASPQEREAEARKRQAESTAATVWKVTTSASPMDDSKGVIAAIESKDVVVDWLNAPKAPRLIIQCSENETSLVVDVGGPLEPELGRHREYTIRTRLDDEKAQELVASGSVDGDAVFLPKAISAIKGFEGHKTLTVEVTPFKTRAQAFTFDVSTAGDAIVQVRAACGW